MLPPPCPATGSTMRAEHPTVVSCPRTPPTATRTAGASRCVCRGTWSVLDHRLTAFDMAACPAAPRRGANHGTTAPILEMDLERAAPGPDADTLRRRRGGGLGKPPFLRHAPYRVWLIIKEVIQCLVRFPESGPGLWVWTLVRRKRRASDSDPGPGDQGDRLRSVSRKGPARGPFSWRAPHSRRPAHDPPMNTRSRTRCRPQAVRQGRLPPEPVRSRRAQADAIVSRYSQRSP